MPTRDIFANLSPLDNRYWLSNERVFDGLSERISERAMLKSCARVEAALVEAHLARRGLSAPAFGAALAAAVERLDPDAVAAEEEKTRHNIRALVNVFQRGLPSEIAPLVHLGATSADILDTARSLAVRSAVTEIILPLLAKVDLELCRLVVDEAETPQVGRTHGQHAVPITFGFAMAEYASRLGQSVLRARELASSLRGKLAGATGSYNALSMIYPDPEDFEREFLARLGLEPAPHSTQIVEPEPMIRLLLELDLAFGVMANVADDFRNLQRTEIGELREAFGKDQVGSSTMPQKRNPWNSEHVKSLWKAFSPRAVSFLLDQISEHQRDLTNSASERFVADWLAGLAAAANRLLGVLKGITPDRERMLANLAMTGATLLAEPAYILLAESGRADAHEIVRRATLAVEKEGLGFGEALRREGGASEGGAFEAIAARLRELGHTNADEFFAKPWKYNGRAAERARKVGTEYRSLMKGIAEGGVA
ncbi:MAG TPA: lyase family protein [Rectinemataceae bacterium]|nr:lyase family protein [Rectinemataceae bacterium]